MQNNSQKSHLVLSNCSASSGVIISGCPEDSKSMIPSELLFMLVSPRSNDNGVRLFLKKKLNFLNLKTNQINSNVHFYTFNTKHKINLTVMSTYFIIKLLFPISSIQILEYIKCILYIF